MQTRVDSVSATEITFRNDFFIRAYTLSIEFDQPLARLISQLQSTPATTTNFLIRANVPRICTKALSPSLAQTSLP